MFRRVVFWLTVLAIMAIPVLSAFAAAGESGGIRPGSF